MVVVFLVVKETSYSTAMSFNITEGQLAHPVEMLDQFTNFEQGYKNGGYPARCFVRYRVGVEDWDSFWERSRNKAQ